MRYLRNRTGIILIIFMALISICGFSVPAYAGTTELAIEVTYDQTSARQMLDMINEFRHSDEAWAWDSSDTEKTRYTGLSDLTYDYELEKAAMKRAAEIALLFAHTRPNRQRSSSVGGWGTSNSIYGTACGENIAGGRSAVKDTFIQWREDNENYSGQGHRRNMLSSDFKTIGIGHVVFNRRHFWVQQFGNAAHTSEYPARDETVTEVITVDDTLIKSVSLSVSSPDQSLTVPYGADHAYPGTQASVFLKLDDANETWPSAAPVQPALSWQTDDSEVLNLGEDTFGAVKAGTANLTTSFMSEELTVPVTVTPLDITEASVTAAVQTYDGGPLTPALTVSLNGKTLAAGADYEAGYSSNINAGTAAVTVTGKGNYTGNTSGSFEILPADISEAVVSDLSPVVYTGQAITPEPTVRKAGTELKNGEDYDLTASNNVAAGEASLTLTGKGNYTGTLTRTFTIKPVDLTSLSLDPNTPVTYTGEAQTPQVTVRGLPDGAVFETVYTDNINAGTSSVTVTGTRNCAGTLTGSFTVSPADLTDALVAAENQWYTGAPIEPAVTVTLSGRTLDAGTDYTEPAFTENTEEGTASVSITGRGNYTGRADGTFSIYKVSVEDCAAEIADNELVYSGAEQHPALALAYDREELTEGSDYEREDLDNINAGTAKIRITGTGRFKGERILSYTIWPADLSSADCTDIGDQTYTGDAVTPVYEISLNGNVLAKNADYEETLTDNRDAGEAAMTVTGKGNYTGTLTRTFTIKPVDLTGFRLDDISPVTYTGEAQEPRINVNGLPGGAEYTISYDSNVDAGEAQVTVTGTKNCEGTLNGSFTISPADLSEAEIVPEKEEYVFSGQPITPPVTVTLHGHTLEENIDYTLSLENNTDRGTAKIIAAGLHNFRGTAEGSFRITGIKLDGEGIEITGPEPQPYTGSAVIPEITVSFNGILLREGTDYIRKDADNISAGTASVTLEGIGGYEGTRKLTYRIMPLDLTGAEVTAADAVYTGKALKPKTEVTLDGKKLTEGTDYRVSFRNNTAAGTAAVTVTGAGNYTGTAKGTFIIAKAENALVLKKGTYSVNASAKEQTLQIEAEVTGGKVTYTPDSTAISVSESGLVVIPKNTAGTFSVKVRAAGDGNYLEDGESTVTIKVNPIAGQITAKDITAASKTKVQKVSVGAKRRGTGKLTYQSSNKSIKVNADGIITIPKRFVGRAVITIGAKASGIYRAASKKVVLTVNPAAVKLVSVKAAGSKKMKVRWKKNPTGTGYQIQYALKKNFRSAKTVNVKKAATVKKTIKKLKAKKTYYVRIRATRKVSGKIYYSAWSRAGKIRIAK